MVKRATSLFNSFCGNAAKQVARFCCPRFTIPLNDSLRKQPTFGDATTGFPAKRRLRNSRRNSILMTRHYPDLGSASDWSCRVGNLFQPITSTTQIWVWNFCARFSDVISRGNQWWRRQMSAVFSGYYLITLCNVAYNIW